MSSKKSRQSNIELLRIISMLMILSCHFFSHGNFNFENNIWSVPAVWSYVIQLGGKLGAATFVFITGFFLIHDTTIFNFKKIARFWGQIFFYSITFYCLNSFLTAEFSIVNLIKSFFPLTFQIWWFASTYFVLFLLHPFINKLLLQLNKRSFQTLICLLVFMWIIIPTFLFSSYQSNSLLTFITIYCIAGYIRLYGLSPALKTKHFFFVFCFSCLIIYASNIAIRLLSNTFSFFEGKEYFFYEMNKLPLLIAACSLFMMFSRINLSYNKTINLLARASFGVYLIHDYPSVRDFLWLDLFKNNSYARTCLLIPYSIGVAILVYITCSLIDLLRQCSIEKVYILLTDKLIARFSPFTKKLYNKFLHFIFG
ncbi:MAG: acyltransferase [Clostridia bacterium]|nr:acyltransferase [Clostridia bacterium]